MSAGKNAHAAIDLSAVEKVAVQASSFDILYSPTEHIPAIVVENFPALGKLAAMRFLEWVQANLVLLIPLMLATPARSYAQRFGRLGLALDIALVLQVLDIAVTVKSFYATHVGGFSDSARWLYQFGDAFAQSMDTQLFPFAIWAGIHFNQLLGRGPSGDAPTAAPSLPKGLAR